MEANRWNIIAVTRCPTAPTIRWGGGRRGWVRSSSQAIAYVSYDSALRTVARGLRGGVWTESMVRVVPA
jgi:hypothetical protein